MFRKIIALLLVGGILVAGYVERKQLENLFNSTSTAVPDPIVTPAPYNALIPVPTPRHDYGTLDPTTSTNGAFAVSVKASLVHAVAVYVPPKPSKLAQGGGVPPIPELVVTVNLVETLPAQTGAPAWSVTVPAVPGLRPEPQLTKSSLALGGSVDQWNAAQATWSKAYDAALNAAMKSATALQHDINLSIQQYSSISGAMEAMAQLAEGTSNTSFFIASDLIDNQARQSGVSFNGAPVVVDAACPSGSVARCKATFDSFASWAKANGAGTVTRVDPGNVDQALQSWINRNGE
jgi:hypothetical protein